MEHGRTASDNNDEQGKDPSTGRYQQFVLDKEGKIPLVPGRETALWFLGGKTIMDSFL
jgi:hypothetical protein